MHNDATDSYTKFTMHEMLDDLKKSFKAKYCMARKAIGSCSSSGKTPKCHTISKQASLKKISSLDGHVYIIFPNEDNFYKKIGVNDATIFYGFCRKHDTDIFSVIENATSSLSTPKQLFVLAYRSLCLRLYKKEANMRFINRESVSNRLIDKKKHAFGIQTAIDDLTHYKNIYDSILQNNSYSELSSIVIKLESVPKIMGTGFIFPEFDLDMNAIQDLTEPNITPIGFSVNCVGTPNGNEGLITISATKNSRSLLLTYYDQLQKLSHDHLLETVVKILFLKEENIVFNIDWWDNLDTKLKETVKDMFFVHSRPARSDDDVPNEMAFLKKNHGFFETTKIKSIELIN